MIFFGGSLRASQPSSMAPPILPAPTSTSAPGMEASECCLAVFAMTITLAFVMAGLVPAIHAFPCSTESKAWMAGIEAEP